MEVYKYFKWVSIVIFDYDVNSIWYPKQLVSSLLIFKSNKHEKNINFRKTVVSG